MRRGKIELPRHRRERAFQQRVLAAIEKPARNRFIAVINSAAFLWLLSAVLIAGGGSYMSNHLQCLKDANQLIDRRRELLVELGNRSDSFIEAIQNSDTNVKLIRASQLRGSGHSEFSQMSYFDLISEYLKLNLKVTYENEPYPEIQEAQSSWMNFIGPVLRRDLEFAVTDYLDYARSTKINVRSAGTQIAVDRITTEYTIQAPAFEFQKDLNSFYPQPNCSIINVEAMLFGYEPPIVYASFSPIYDIRGVLRQLNARMLMMQDVLRGMNPIPRASR